MSSDDKLVETYMAFFGAISDEIRKWQGAGIHRDIFRKYLIDNAPGDESLNIALHTLDVLWPEAT